MGCYSGPEINESGLVLCLDAGNNRSYSRNKFLCPGTVGEGAAADNNVTFALNGTGTFVRMGHGQTIGNYTIKPTDVVYRYAMGGTGCFFHGNKITVPQGSFLNFSFDYLVTGATTYPITDYLANIEDYSGGGLGNAIGVANNTQGIWQRRVMQSGPAATTVTDCNVLLYPGACNNPTAGLSNDGIIYYRNPRAEIINYDPDPSSRGFDSGFTYATNINLVSDISGLGNNGTFSNTGNAPLYSSANGGSWIFDGSNDILSIPFNASTMNFSAAQTISMWMRPGAGSNTSRRNPYNQAYGGPGTLTYETDGSINYYFGTNGGDGLPYVGKGSGFTVAAGETAFITVTRNQASNVTNWYKNGVLITTSDAGGYAATANGTSAIYIGFGYAGAFLGNIYECKVYNRALTASEVRQNFNATRGRFGI